MFANIVASLRFTLPVREYPMGPSLRHLVRADICSVLVPHELMASLEPVALDSGTDFCLLIYGQVVMIPSI